MSKDKNDKQGKKDKEELFDVKLFGKWKFTDVNVKDDGIRDYINLKPVYFPRTYGKHARHRFHKNRMNIIERLATHLMVPGHKGGKHFIYSGDNPAKFMRVLKVIENAFEKIEKKTNENPIAVLVKAIENSAMLEEVTSVQVGSIMARNAVVTGPQRRVDKALRNISQGVYKQTKGSKAKAKDVLAKELIAAYKNNPEKSQAVKEKDRMEREAVGAR